MPLAPPGAWLGTTMSQGARGAGAATVEAILRLKIPKNRAAKRRQLDQFLDSTKGAGRNSRLLTGSAISRARSGRRRLFGECYNCGRCGHFSEDSRAKQNPKAWNPKRTSKENTKSNPNSKGGGRGGFPYSCDFRWEKGSEASDLRGAAGKRNGQESASAGEGRSLKRSRK